MDSDKTETMKTNRHFTRTFSLIALSLAVVSCGKGNGGSTDDGRSEIRLSSSVERTSRAAFTDADTQIQGGESVTVWIDETGGVPIYENIPHTADGRGGLASGTKMYFPESRKNADIYALHTNATLTGAPYPIGALIHTVKTDQRTLADYTASDLLYSRASNVARTSSAVGLTFHHLLSKIRIAVVPGKGITAASIKGITVGGMKTAATFTLDRAIAPEATQIGATGTTWTITASVDVSDDPSSPLFNEIVVVPQRLDAGTPFITLQLASGYLLYRLPDDVTFESGKRYTYRITANLAELTLTTSITDWTPINPVSGTATLE